MSEQTCKSCGAVTKDDTCGGSVHYFKCPEAPWNVQQFGYSVTLVSEEELDRANQRAEAAERELEGWRMLATDLANSLLYVQHVQSKLAKLLGDWEDAKSVELVQELGHHLAGTDIGCSWDYGIYYTKDGWTTERCVLLPNDVIPKRQLSLFPATAPAEPVKCDECKKKNRVISTAHDILHQAPELNLSNYDESQVGELNAAVIEAYLVLDAAMKPASEKPADGGPVRKGNQMREAFQLLQPHEVEAYLDGVPLVDLSEIEASRVRCAVRNFAKWARSDPPNREERALDALIVAAARGIDPAEPVKCDPAGQAQPAQPEGESGEGEA